MRGPLLLTILFPATCAPGADPEPSSSATTPRCVDPITTATRPCAELEAEAEAVDGPRVAPSSSGGDASTAADEADVGTIRAAIRAQSTGVQRCYERALQRAPDLQGRLVAEITLVDGQITALALTVEEGRLDEAVLGCVRSEIRTWALPADASADLSVPFRLIAG